MKFFGTIYFNCIKNILKEEMYLYVHMYCIDQKMATICTFNTSTIHMYLNNI